MPRNLNLNSAVRWIHWAPPGDLDGLNQVVKAKMAELKLSPGKRDNILPQNLPGDPSVNVRGIVDFVNDCEAVNEGDSEGEKAAKQDALKKLCQLSATLAARCAAAGYKPPEAEKPSDAPPLPSPTPDPKPLA